MNVRLSDLRAPEWRHTLSGTERRMKPLSLATFAEAEGQGLTLSLLSKGSLEPWVQLYCFLAALDDSHAETVVTDFLTDPLGFQAFKSFVSEAFANEDAAYEGPTTPKPQVLHPKKKDAPEQEPERDDMKFIVTLARMSGIPLSDLFQMTFRGLRAVQKSIEDLPQQNPMQMMGAMFGGGSSKPI